MFDIRKLTLCTLAVGLMALPVLAGMDDQEQLESTKSFQTYDQDGNGAVTIEEFAESLDKHISLDTFSVLDTDQNGVLNEEEFTGLSEVAIPEESDSILFSN